MGVETRLVLFAADSAAGLAAARAAFDRIALLDSLMSDYRMESELNRISGAAGEPVAVSGDMLRVLAIAQDMAQRTDGVFDVTAGPLVLLWREARRAGRLPEPEALAAARHLVDWRRLHVEPDAGQVRLEAAGMRLDLGGIAKGYAAEAARATLGEHGTPRCLVEIGGDLAVGEAPPGRDGWRISVGSTAASRRTLSLANTAVATSGDAEQYVAIDGVRYSHVVEPATGMGSSRGVSATVIGPDGARADALATAATLLDDAGRERLIRDYPGYDFIIDRPDA